MIFLSRLSFWCLVILALIYAGQLGHALTMSVLTDPPVCKIATSTVLPSPLCPGLNWDQHTRFLLSLPGAYLSYPLEIGPKATNPLILANPQFIILMLMHLFGWGYVIARVARWLRRRRNLI